jgi:hypothetical protein
MGYSTPTGDVTILTTVSQPPQNQAQQAIDAAQTAINTAYATLAFADSVGSSITDLIGTLNAAIIELNHARIAYNRTDYSTAITLAETAETTAQAVGDEAQFRGITTLSQTQAQFVLVFAVVLLSFPIGYFAITSWQKYRKEKRRTFLRMEVRLPDDEVEDENS